jgi:hypothetical protein
MPINPNEIASPARIPLVYTTGNPLVWSRGNWTSSRRRLKLQTRFIDDPTVGAFSFAVPAAGGNLLTFMVSELTQGPERTANK